MSAASWSAGDRSASLERAARDGVDLLVVGGGITGAGVLRDAATRGIRSLLVEKEDFASGTSSRSSKMVHGGLRYIAEGQLAVTRESCRERDRLRRLAPNLVRPLPFVFPIYDDSRISLWKMRAALSVYAGLAGFRRSARFQMLGSDALRRASRDLRADGLRGAALYHDAQVDDVRLVLATLVDARSLGASALNHVCLVGFEREAGRLCAAKLRDETDGRIYTVRADSFVNAAGPEVERVQGLDVPIARPALRPAKGVHLVIDRTRVHVEAAVTFEAPDRRNLFLAPWGDVVLLGTTDAFTDEIDEPIVTLPEVRYLLDAANRAFPAAALTTNDIRSVFAGVRPLVADPDAPTPSTSVSREDRVEVHASGLVSACGGKLTTYRATAERIVDRVVGAMSPARAATLAASGTAQRPLRNDDFETSEYEAWLCRRFELEANRASHLVSCYGADATLLLESVPPELHRPIGESRYLYAEIPWSIAHECPESLCDLLERRLRLAILGAGQGLPELGPIAELAARAAGWGEERANREAAAYGTSVRRRYQIVASGSARSAA